MNTAVYAARERKAALIAAWVKANRPDIDADLAEILDERGRRVVAQLAGVNPPSDETWEIVVARLRHPARPLRVVPDDPWAGLPS